MMKFNKIILVFVFIISCQNLEATSSLSPDAIKLSTKTFDPKKKEVLQLSFKPNQDVDAEVNVYNFLGEKVATILKDKVEKNKVEEVKWNGRDSSGKVISPGIYYYTIALKNEKEAMVYNPYSETQGILLTLTESRYDAEKNQFYFRLPQAAMVRIRINLKKGGPIMATPLDWTALPAGEYRFPWDGKDVSGLIDIKNHPELNIMIYAFSLADNSVIVGGETKLDDKPFVILNDTAMAKQEFPLNLPADRYIHSRKDPRLNRVARIEVTFPGAKMKNGLPVLSEKAPVRVTVDPRDQWIAEMSRYELMFYVDTLVVFEDESGFAPFTYNLNTKDLTPGEHVLTINLLTYDDHYATVSKKIIVAYEKDKKT